MGQSLPIDMTATRAQCPLHLQYQSNIGTAAKRRFVPKADIRQSIHNCKF